MWFAATILACFPYHVLSRLKVDAGKPEALPCAVLDCTVFFIILGDKYEANCWGAQATRL